MKFLVLVLLCASSILGAPNIGGRIVGGELARGGQFPFAVAIYVTRGGGTYFYGGALLSNQWILTAAQCVDGAVTFRIQAGSNSLEGADGNRVILATSTYVIHPDYNPNTLENDIGLIKLRLAISFNEYINAIPLPTSFLPDYASVTAIGWGQVDDFSTGISDTLHFIPVSTISNDECQLTYGSQITHNMLCAAGNYNEGICNGDMGGPLVQSVGGTTVHVGVASFRSQNGCETVDPSGYTRTIPYVEWINSVMSSI